MRIFFTIIKFIVFAPVIVLIRVISPLVRIRFGYLESDRIGHLGANTDIYLSQRKAGLLPPRTIDVFGVRHPIANEQLLRMVARVLTITKLIGPLNWVNELIPGTGRHVVSIRNNKGRDIDGLCNVFGPHVSFSNDELQKGLQLRTALGVPPDAQHICLLCRDSSYLAEHLPQLDASYHDYRDSSISTLTKTAEALAEKGYYVLRMGAHVSEPLVSADPRIIDYANLDRSDFMDIYLGATCYFCLCDSAGYFAVPTMFRRPVAWFNLVPLDHLHSWKQLDISLPSLMVNEADGELIPFKEVLDLGAGNFLRSEQFVAAGISVRHNSADEICELAMEMTARLDGSYQEVPGDEELQKRFWQLFEANERHRVFSSRIGADFLRRYQHLLEPPSGRD